MRVQKLKQRRTAGGIPGGLLAARSGIQRSRLSDVERGYVTPSEGELTRLERALDELLEARKQVEEVAAKVGWPMS